MNMGYDRECREAIEELAILWGVDPDDEHMDSKVVYIAKWLAGTRPPFYYKIMQDRWAAERQAEIDADEAAWQKEHNPDNECPHCATAVNDDGSCPSHERHEP